MNHYAEGLRAFAQGKLELAITHFSDAIASGDNVANAHSKRGVSRLRLGDPVAAEGDFRAALAADDRCLSAIVNLGNLMLERDDRAAARVFYDRALRIDETYAVAHYNLGVLLRREGDIAASVRELRLAAKYEARPSATRTRLSFWKRR